MRLQKQNKAWCLVAKTAMCERAQLYRTAKWLKITLYACKKRDCSKNEVRVLNELLCITTVLEK